MLSVVISCMLQIQQIVISLKLLLYSLTPTWQIENNCFVLIHDFLLFIPLFPFLFVLSFRCLQNYIPPQSLTLSCPVCRQTSILPEKGVAALQNNFFITNLMEVLQRDPECSRPEACSVLESVSAAAAGKPLSCPNHEGKVSSYTSRFDWERNFVALRKLECLRNSIFN